jgi:hypothetical protein
MAVWQGEESAQLNKQVLFPSASLLGPPPTYIDVEEEEEEEIERTDVLFESYGLYDVVKPFGRTQFLRALSFARTCGKQISPYRLAGMRNTI